MAHNPRRTFLISGSRGQCKWFKPDRNMWHACSALLFCISSRYRHAAPSAPWPWMDINTDASEVRPLPPDGSEWGQYPQSLFGNWTSDQVNRCKMLTDCSDSDMSTTYKIRVCDDGSFDQQVETRTVLTSDTTSVRAYWNYLGTPVSGARVACFDLEAETATTAPLGYPSTSTFC